MSPMVRFFQLASNCILGLLFALSILIHTDSAQGASFKVLHSFSGGSNGCYPAAGVIIDGAGNLYGTTAGDDGFCSLGTVFRLASDDTETVLYNFIGESNGEGPEDTLVMDKKGNLYGATIGGGSVGCGVVFEVERNGSEKTVHDFAGPPNDGCTPIGGLIRDKHGNFYGTTNGGGKNRVGRFPSFGGPLNLYNTVSVPSGASSKTVPHWSPQPPGK